MSCFDCFANSAWIRGDLLWLTGLPMIAYLSVILASMKKARSPGPLVLLAQALDQSGLMFVAWSPFGPVVMSKETFWFSFRLLKPEPWIAEKCANTSLPPPSGVIKPKPFASLNHLTVPVAMSVASQIKIKNSGSSPPCRYHQERLAQGLLSTESRTRPAGTH